MAGLYSIIEGAHGRREALIWPSLGKSREAFTAMLVAANAYYLSLATASAEDARRNTETIEKTIPEMSELAENDLQRMALQRLKARTLALREGFAKLSEQLASRTELLRNTIDASQAEAIGAIDNLSVKMRQREQKAQATFDRTMDQPALQGEPFDLEVRRRDLPPDEALALLQANPDVQSVYPRAMTQAQITRLPRTQFGETSVPPTSTTLRPTPSSIPSSVCRWRL